MNKFKGIVKLSQAQYDTLKEQGSITIKGKTFLYDPTNTIYVTKDSGVTANKVTSVNGETGDVTLTSESVNAVSKSVDTLIGSPNTILNTEDGISISGNKVSIGGTTDVVGDEVIGTQITSDNIQVRTSGSTQGYTPKIIDISSGEIAITGFDLTLDGKQVATLEDIENGSSNGITELVGTDEKPINFATDMEIGKLYSCSGRFINQYGVTEGFVDVPALIYKCNTSELIWFGKYWADWGHTSNRNSITTLVIDENGRLLSRWPSMGIGAINGGYDSYDIYAPTTPGTQGQVLASSGDSEPIWTDLPSGGIEQLVGTEENPINFATDMKVGHLYSVSGSVRHSSSSIKNYNNPTLFYKWTEKYIDVYGAVLISGTPIWRNGFVSRLEINSETGYYGASNCPLPVISINGTTAASSQSTYSSIYAPTTGGTMGQILQSNGSNTSPVWVDMPEIPSIEGLATEEYVNNAIGNLTSINFTPVTGLPTENISTTTIYLLPIEGDTNNTYEEYIYVNDTWEKIGTTSVDLSGYVTTAQLEEVTNTTSTALQPEDAATTSDIDSLFELVDNDNPSLPEEGRE